MKISGTINFYIPAFGKSHSLMNVRFAETPVQLREALAEDTFVQKKENSQQNPPIKYIETEKKTFGTFSYEELEKTKRIMRAFSESDLTTLKQTLLDKLKDLAVELNNNDNDETRKKINILTLYIYTLNMLLYADTPKFNHTKYSDWYNTSLGEQNVFISGTIFEHPLDKSLSLRGTFSKDELEECKNMEKEKFAESTESILNQKIQISDKMHSLLISSQSDFLGGLHDEDLEKLRELSIQSQALENILISRGINTKEIEKIKYATSIPDNIKTGDYIKGLGLVINKFNIKSANNGTIPTITVFSFNRKTNMIRMYNLKELQKKASLEEITSTSSLEKINEINEKAKSFIKEQEENSLISEIRFSPLDKTKNSGLLKDTKEELKETIQKELNKGCYFVTHFLNRDSHKFPNAGKITGFQLLELLDKSDSYPIFVKAAAYNGGKRSPVALYKKIGFTPYSHSEEEISQLRKENKGRFPVDIPVYMYLPKCSTASENVKKFREIFLSLIS